MSAASRRPERPPAGFAVGDGRDDHRADDAHGDQHRVHGREHVDERVGSDTGQALEPLSTAREGLDRAAVVHCGEGAAEAEVGH